MAIKRFSIFPSNRQKGPFWILDWRGERLNGYFSLKGAKRGLKTLEEFDWPEGFEPYEPSK